MEARQHRGGTAGTIAPALSAFLLLLAVFAPPSAARSTAGCEAKPGNPAVGAVAQYCPAEEKKAAPAAADPGADLSSTGQSVAAAPVGGGGDGPGGSPEKSAPEIPLTDYPSSGGVNVLLIAVLIAIAIAVAYGARRWRRSSAEAP